MTSCNPCCEQDKIINPSVDPSNWNFCNLIAYILGILHIELISHKSKNYPTFFGTEVV